MAVTTEKIISFDEFKSIIIETLQELLGPEKEVTTHKVLKNNGIYLEGIMVKNTASGISPTFYLETLYDMYKSGMALDQVVDHIMPFYKKDYSSDFFGKNLFGSYDSIKDSLFIKLINTEKNQMLLDSCPSMSFLDLSEVVYVSLSDVKDGGVGTTTVNFGLLETWGVDFETVHSQAMINTREKLGVTIDNMADFLCELLERQNGLLPDEDCPVIPDLKERDTRYPMYVMTNSSRFLGASSLLFDEYKDFADSIGSDLYIIPSSIHEMLLVPVTGEINRDDLSEVLNLVNTTELASSEYLSENVYYYSRNSRGICI